LKRADHDREGDAPAEPCVDANTSHQIDE